MISAATHSCTIHRHLSVCLFVLNLILTFAAIVSLVAVVICFFLCWAPFHAQRLIAVYGSSVILTGVGEETSLPNEDKNDFQSSISNVSSRHDHTAHNSRHHEQVHHEIVYTVMTYISGVLYYLSTCINPLLYNLMSNKFRQAFKVSLVINSIKILIIIIAIICHSSQYCLAKNL